MVSCSAFVTPSRERFAKTSAMPKSSEERPSLLGFEANTHNPIVIRSTERISTVEYRLPFITAPMHITGMSLQDFARMWRGKEM